MQIGTIDKAQDIFTSLRSNQNKEAKEYGEYGLLLLAFETEDMPDMQKRIQSIEDLENSTSWLSKELRNYKTYYNYNTAKFTKAEELLESIPISDIYNDALLSSIKADLYIRKNYLDKAKNTLEKLKVDNEYLRLLYNQCLIQIDQKKAIDNAINQGQRQKIVIS